RPVKYLRLANRPLGDFDFGAQLDLAQDGVELGISGAIPKEASRGLELGEGRGVERAPEEPKLEFVERVERKPPALDGGPPPGARVFDSLQGDQCIDTAHRPQGARRNRRCGRPLFGHGKAGRGGSPRVRSGKGGSGGGAAGGSGPGPRRARSVHRCAWSNASWRCPPIPGQGRILWLTPR